VSGSASWRRALWPGVAALVAVMGIGRFAYTPILPSMLASGALTLREAGWVASANFAGYLAGAMPCARLAERLRARTLARAGLLGSVAALAAMAVTDGVAAWVAVRFAAGFASAVAMVFVSTLIFERLAALGETGRSMWLYAGVSVGIALSAPAVHAVESSGAAWTTAWLVAAAGAAAFVATVIAYGLFGLGYVVHATYLPAMVRAAGYPPQAASWVWVLVGVAAVPVIAAAGLGATFIPVTGLALTYARALDRPDDRGVRGRTDRRAGRCRVPRRAFAADGRPFGPPSRLACVALLLAAVAMRRAPRAAHGGRLGPPDPRRPAAARLRRRRG
jgi:MFS family permease